MIRVVASDLDGTLLDPNGEVSARTAAALTAARDKGIDIIAVTGRPPRWVHHLAPGLTVSDGALELPDEIGRPLVSEGELTSDASAQVAICSNGALVIDLATKAILTEHSLSATDAGHVVRRLSQCLPGASFAVEWGDGFGCDEAWRERLDRLERPLRNVDMRFEVAPVEKLVTAPVVKVLAWHPERAGDDLIEVAATAVGSLATVTSSGPQQLVEVSAKGVDKGSSLAEWCTARGIDRAEVVAFGDARNDVTMLAWAGTGVAMAGSHPDAVAVADEITGTNADDGVAAWLERHLFSSA